MDWIDVINFSMAASGLVVALLATMLSVMLPVLSPWTKRFFVIFFSVVAGYISSNITSQISLSFLGDNFAVLSQTAVFLESLFSSFLMPLMTIFLLHSSGEEWRKNRWFHIAFVVWVMYFCMLCDTQISGLLYHITEENEYQRGPFYPVLLIPPVTLMIYNLIVLFTRRSRISEKHRKALLINILIPTIGIMIQMFFYGLLMIVISTSLGALLMFVFMMVDDIKDHNELMEKEVKQQANIVVLQMRPHFIYNTLTSIYYLCRENPQDAMQAILDFSEYLRRNFTAVVSEKLIPFKEELSHVKAYLNVEKTRFPEELFVKYDISCTSFMIPPLSVQPLVENSVKHGLDPEEDPLRIFIRTREISDGFEVIVEDTGVGFKDLPESGMDNSGNHIAIDNIKTRLAMMCDGTLSILPRGEGGTIARIRVPKSNEIKKVKE